jgi:hypothetical protein
MGWKTNVDDYTQLGLMNEGDEDDVVIYCWHGEGGGILVSDRHIDDGGWDILSVASFDLTIGQIDDLITNLEQLKAHLITIRDEETNHEAK